MKEYIDCQRLGIEAAQLEAEAIKDCVKNNYAEDYKSAHAKFLRIVDAGWASCFEKVMQEMDKHMWKEWNWNEYDWDVFTGVIETPAPEQDDLGIWEKIDIQHHGIGKEFQIDYGPEG
ncbi:MAG: hypothetical protein WCP03_00140 [Candidatus Saccharibacteria bacterium]